MFVNLTHPDFDMDMEIALFIPQSPSSVPMSSVAQDLGLGSQSRVQEAVRRFKKDESLHVRRLGSHRAGSSRKETGVRSLNTKNGRSVQISHDAWPEFKKRAEAYWKKVYA